MEFNVIGIGEINKKTVEGTTAVFISSFVSLVAVYWMLIEPGVELFYYNYIATLFFHAIVSMIVEVAAPRSTDNFFLQTFGLYILLISYKA
jgi:dolichol kinase